MSLQTTFICSAATAIHSAIVENKSEIESLDQAIGDGDHYINILRGAETVLEMLDELSPLRDRKSVV